ncbi:MAG TPA: DUF2254 domain-containing protein [Asanoa sp.]
MIRRDAISEYSRGALWVLPTICAVVAIAVGLSLSFVDVGPRSLLAFQGTADDARTLLIGISSTMVTVIALLLGLAVVALQLSSTQFSPRLLRNFLRDRPNQVVLGVFVGTFAYSAGGLFTVGISGGQRVDEFPRFAVSVAIALLFLSLALLVFFADHLVHSIQVDAIMRVVERNTLPLVRAAEFSSEEPTPEPPAWAARVPSSVSGYLQRVDVSRLAAEAAQHGFAVRLRPRIGEHVVAGTTFAWVWRPTAGDTPPDVARLGRQALYRYTRLGFERTLEQDPSFGLRQLVDMACKALSPAVNDPYTAVQAIERLSVLYAELATRPVGDCVVRDPRGAVVAVVAGRRFAEHLALGCGLIRRYGAREPTVAYALLRMLTTCAELAGDRPGRRAAIDREARLIVDAAERDTVEPADLAWIRRQIETLGQVGAA